MAVALTSDPIIAVADVQALIPGLTSTDRVNFLINSVSDAFLNFTGRISINDDDLTQYETLPPTPYQYIYLRATPVTAITTVTLMHDGEDDEELTSDEYKLENATTGKLVLPSHSVSGRGHGYMLKIEFTGGWTAIPGDIQEAALQAIVYKREKLDGRAGVRTASMEGVTSGYETADLPQSVRDCWAKYRIY